MRYNMWNEAMVVGTYCDRVVPGMSRVSEKDCREMKSYKICLNKNHSTPTGNVYMRAREILQIS